MCVKQRLADRPYTLVDDMTTLSLEPRIAGPYTGSAAVKTREACDLGPDRHGYLVCISSCKWRRHPLDCRCLCLEFIDIPTALSSGVEGSVATADLYEVRSETPSGCKELDETSSLAQICYVGGTRYE